MLTYQYVADPAAMAAQLQADTGHRYSNPRLVQWIVYGACLRDHGHKHAWLGARLREA